MTEPRITRHSYVSFTYVINDQEGNLLERSDLPMSYVHGSDAGLFIPIERALEGRCVGDSVDVILAPEQGFGPHDPSLTFTDDIENVPPQYRHVGAEVEFQNDSGESRKFTVSRIEDGKLTVDGNHPFAGKTLVFTVNVIAVRDATPDEIVNGVSAPGSMPLH